MKMRVRLLAIGVVATAFLTLTAVQPTFAQAVLTEDQAARIRAHCLSIKNTLSQLHASDALLRVNRGQFYEALSSRLMNNFNARLTNNGLDAKGLISVTGNYQTALTTFRADYTTYESQLSKTIRIDCREDPQAFHNSVLDAREKRAKVHESVQRLNRHIEDYRSAVNDFKLNFERITEDAE